MFKDRVILRLLTVVCFLTGPASSCFPDMTSTCPFYNAVTQATLIPIPDPGNLDIACSELQQGLQCLLRPSVLGNCDLATRTIYSSISNVLQYPCQLMRTDYLSGSECWKSTALHDMMRMCYMENKQAISTDYCSGQKSFANCTMTDILEVDHCGKGEQRILTTMVVTSYNDNGLILERPCHPLPMPTTTTTTTTTKSPVVETSSRREASARSTSSKEMTTSRSSEGKSTTAGTGGGGKMMTKASRRSGAGASTVVPMAHTVYGAAMGLSLLLLVQMVGNV